MITYDTPGIVSQKVEYIKTRRLGGAMWWETSDDRPSSSNDSLIGNAAKALGGLGNNDLEKNENCLDYPQSKYDNLRQGMPDE
jgi:chitinase